MKTALTAVIVFLVACFVGVGAVQAKTILVPEQARTIQKAIDKATNGDKILVSDGMYGPISIVGKNITIKSVHGPAMCTISGKLSGRAVYIEGHGEDASKVSLDGLTITKGKSAEYEHGGGIYSAYTTLVVRNCIIKGNNANSCGGGIFAECGRLTIIDCLVTGNTAAGSDEGSNGGGIFFNNAPGQIIRCKIIGNEGGAGGGILVSGTASDVVMRDNTIANNRAPEGGGVFIGSGATLRMDRCSIRKNKGNYGAGLCTESGNTRNTEIIINNTVFVGNRLEWEGGRGGAVYADYTNVALTNCTLWANQGKAASAFCSYGSGTIFVRNSIIWRQTRMFEGKIAFAYCCVQGYTPPGQGNTSVNPQFSNPKSSDFSLTDGSPLIDAGNNQYVHSPKDLLGLARVVDYRGTGSATVDIGAYERPASTP